MSAPSGVGAAAEPDWAGRWSAALDEMELNVERAERMLQSAAHPFDPLASPAAVAMNWTPPVIPAPLPAELRARAQSILERQVAASAGLTRAMADSRRHSTLADRLRSGMSDARVPVFVDSRS